jgi:hypothetical protein
VETPGNLTEALRRALDNAPAVLDVATSQLAVSSDAKKGLGYIPEYQPLTAGMMLNEGGVVSTWGSDTHRAVLTKNDLAVP